ncbi:MAG TPA: aminotransferase class I/II-fold pyridoxal phosphate-dependent enzyme [Pirellulales bacterium]|jgi:aspartate aminotransferase/aminotransferase|nr:aminotransferase class I/II-fold pyridoxal phosphate-dependent enzyme [Pirellulales bacterium]
MSKTAESKVAEAWIADRTQYCDSSGIRKVFDLAASMKDPINLSIGQPDFDVPAAVQEAAVAAIHGRKNGYALTQGMPVVRDLLAAQVARQYSHADREVFVTSGTSGGLVLTMLAVVNPGDEVIIFDPAFVMYESLIRLVGGKCVAIDTYPDFHVDVDHVRAAITPRTKAILFNSPANPTGVVATTDEIRDLALLAAERNVLLVSDEIYSRFNYDSPFVSPAEFNPQTLVIDGFSKTYGMTGWRVGYAHGPKAVIAQMIKLQQYTFVCAPQPFQWAAAAALDVDMSEHIEVYRGKRDWLLAELAADYEIARPGGAFYIFPRAPWGSGSEFVARAIANELLVIPGNIFSHRDTHFRISYAASDATLRRGAEVLKRLAREGK